MATQSSTNGVKGERLGLYTFTVGYYAGGATLTLQNWPTSLDTYFGSRRLALLDRLGSAGTVNGSAASYYPFREDKSTNASGDAWRFGTYWRDSASGLDYAIHRYYSSALGRFLTPDPYSCCTDLTNPQSWDRYSYALNDPINSVDPVDWTRAPAAEKTEAMGLAMTVTMVTTHLRLSSG